MDYQINHKFWVLYKDSQNNKYKPSQTSLSISSISKNCTIKNNWICIWKKKNLAENIKLIISTKYTYSQFYFFFSKKNKLWSRSQSHGKHMSMSYSCTYMLSLLSSSGLKGKEMGSNSNIPRKIKSEREFINPLIKQYKTTNFLQYICNYISQLLLLFFFNMIFREFDRLKLLIVIWWPIRLFFTSKPPCNTRSELSYSLIKY